MIVPTRNSSRTLEACLKSIRAQTYRDVEIIVIDNGSCDETHEIAMRHADVVEHFGPERSSQRNRGAQIARGTYLLFVDSDMILTPEVVGDCLESARTSGAPGVIVPEISTGDGFWARCRALERSCYAGDDAIEAARFFSREAFDVAGGYDEDLKALEDWDLSVRIAVGARLPRVGSNILHDEGSLRLRPILVKKRYYAASSFHYYHKHGCRQLGHANLVFRPAFLRNWRRFAAHPILAAGVFTLKSLETVAILVGLLDAMVRGARMPTSTQ